MTVSKLKKLQTQTVEFKLKQRDHDNIRLINEALDDDRDLSQLRKLAAVRGLVNHQLRQACWQRLAGAPGGDFDSGAYEQLACKQHRDSTTVKCDVERSLWAFTKGMSEDERAAKRAQLSRLLNAVVNRHPGAPPRAMPRAHLLHRLLHRLLHPALGPQKLSALSAQRHAPALRLDTAVQGAQSFSLSLGTVALNVSTCRSSLLRPPSHPAPPLTSMCLSPALAPVSPTDPILPR